MKTIKIKVKPTVETKTLIPSYLRDLEWVWNKCRYVALHNHCLRWYEWAEKSGVDLTDCIRTPLYFGRRSAWMGATCRIATGGDYWRKDEKTTIAYRAFKNGKWEPRTKHGYKLVKGDQPWLRVAPVTHSPHEMNGKPLNKPDDLDRKAMLNQMRESEGLEPLAMHSDFIGGLIRTVFTPSWDAYLDTKLGQRHQPRYKDGRESKVESLCSSQQPPQFKSGYFVLKNVGADLKFKPVDKHWERELEGRILGSSVKLLKRPSGWYLCLAVSTPAEAGKKALEARLTKARKSATAGIKDKKAKAEAIANSAECQAALELVRENAMQIEIEQYMDSSCSKPSTLSAGVDPGVKAIVATDHGALFNPNFSRGRIALHIEALQSELDGKRESNDRRLGAVWRMGKRDATQAELVLQHKI